MTHPVYPWDSPGLPPRTQRERCGNHRGLCAFRDDDPAYCPTCHVEWVELRRREQEAVAYPERWRISPHPCATRKPRRGTS